MHTRDGKKGNWKHRWAALPQCCCIACFFFCSKLYNSISHMFGWKVPRVKWFMVSVVWSNQKPESSVFTQCMSGGPKRCVWRHLDLALKCNLYPNASDQLMIISVHYHLIFCICCHGNVIRCPNWAWSCLTKTWDNYVVRGNRLHWQIRWAPSPACTYFENKRNYFQSLLPFSILGNMHTTTTRARGREKSAGFHLYTVAEWMANFRMSHGIFVSCMIFS